MIVNGLMRYHIRCVTQPPIDGQSPAGGSSAAEGVASTPQAGGRQREGETASADTGADADADSDGDGGDPNGRGSKPTMSRLRTASSPCRSTPNSDR